MAARELSNAQIADAFDELADLYELDGAIVHRVVAYRAAAKAVREATVSVAALARDGRAVELKGIGKTLQEKIVALASTGTIPAAEKLRAKFPPGLIDVTHLPGLGAKRARLLHSELGIDSLAALRDAALAQRIRTVRGLGPKVEERILEALADADARPPRKGGGRIIISRARELAEELAEGLRKHATEDTEVLIAGSVRRQADSVKDLDLVATSADPAALGQALESLEQIESVSSSKDAGVRGGAHAFDQIGRAHV